jgi:hypothetical protein
LRRDSIRKLADYKRGRGTTVADVLYMCGPYAILLAASESDDNQLVQQFLHSSPQDCQKTVFTNYENIPMNILNNGNIESLRLNIICAGRILVC